MLCWIYQIIQHQMSRTLSSDGTVHLFLKHKSQASQTNLLLHLLHLLHGAPPLRPLIVAVPQQSRADVVGFADVLLLLLLCLLQLVLGAETLSVVHVVRLHHLEQHTLYSHTHKRAKTEI